MKKTQNSFKLLNTASLAAMLFCVFILPTQSHAQDITTGLVGHWRLDETTGTTAADSSGNNNNGTLSGGMDAASDTTAGKVSTAFDFDGVDDGVTIGNPTEVNNIFDTGGTIAMWLYVDPTASNYRFYGKNQPGTSGWLTTDISGKLRFSRNFSGTTGLWDTTADIPTGRWFHFALTYDNDATTNDPAIYFDGVLQPITEAQTPTGTASDDSGDNLVIGNRNNLARSLDGQIDDARFYDRVLTAADIAELYRTTSGTLIFNSDNDTVQYFDDDSWVAAGPSKYKPNAVDFDGTNDYLRLSSALTGVTDSKQITISGWVKTNVTGTKVILNLGDNNPDHLYFRVGFDNRLRLDFSNTSLTDIYQSNAINPALTPGQYYHVLISIDLSDSGRHHIYVDDVDRTTIPTTYTDDTADFTPSRVTVGANFANNNKFDGAFADLWVDFGTYIDFSVEENRRAFIDANGNPVDLGADGSKPTGTSPDVFLSGDTADWHTNKGTGGGFTENGALTTAPSPREENYTLQQIGNAGGGIGVNNKSIASLSENEIVVLDDGNGTGSFQKFVFDGTNWAAEGNAVTGVTNINNCHISALDSETIVVGSGNAGRRHADLSL